MNKKIKNLFLAGAVIFSLAGVAVSCTDYDDDIDKLQDKTTTLETQVKDLTTKLTQAQTDITGLKTSVSELQGAVTTLQMRQRKSLRLQRLNLPTRLTASSQSLSPRFLLSSQILRRRSLPQRRMQTLTLTMQLPMRLKKPRLTLTN